MFVINTEGTSHTAFSRTRRSTSSGAMSSLMVSWSAHRQPVMLGEVRLLTPTAPRKVIAAGLNYRSHLSEAEPALYPGLFAKYPISLIPEDSTAQ